jgi:HD-GYP domain-containing protein (c-di-GMP phosphodiesterase class II)
MAVLSIATDFGMGQPLEFALQTCVLSVRLGETLGFRESDLRAAYYQALLRYIGCNAETHLMAAIVGDELALRTDIIHMDSGSPEFFGLLTRFIREANAARGASPLQLLQAVAGGLARSAQFTKEFFAGHCEVAGRLAQRFGFDEGTVRALSQVYARWDGKGIPPLKGEAIAPSLLAVSLAQDAVAFYRLSGPDAAVAMAKKRKGGMYAPKHVEVFCGHARELFAGLEAEPTWESVLALEPGARHYLTEAEFDAACEAVADFADLKSPCMLGHSPGVARLSMEAARRCGLPEGDVIALRRAALLHDVGRVGVSAGIWGKPGPLSEREWEKVRLHPYHTERILTRPAALAQLGALASLHHERLDGSGYHRGAPAAALSPSARILAAADVYHALTEPRPHRPPQAPEAAANHLKREARAGRLDAEAVSGVLAAAGQRAPSRRKELVAGLSEREVEVLRLIARGHSIKEIAQQLTVAPKTVDNHIQHIYAKTGVTTRAGATLFAMEQNLL